MVRLVLVRELPAPDNCVFVPTGIYFVCVSFFFVVVASSVLGTWENLPTDVVVWIMTMASFMLACCNNCASFMMCGV